MLDDVAALTAARFAYVRDPAPGCERGRCQAPVLTATAAQAVARFGEALERIGQERKEMAMTPAVNVPARALWCEQGGHSFSERDPGMRVIVVEGTDETGAPVSESRTMCGGCAPQVGARLTRPAALAPAAPPPAGPVAAFSAAPPAPAAEWTPVYDSVDGGGRL